MNRIHTSLLVFCILLSMTQTGCMGPRKRLMLSHHRASILHAQSQQMSQDCMHMSMELQQQQYAASMMSQERQAMEYQLSEAQSQLAVANQRVSNLMAERSELHHRYKELLVKARNQQSPLSNDMTRRFQELARKYPDFEFDPRTGVSKFHSDVLFSSGSAELRESAKPLLRELASIMNDRDARSLNMLVVGHTDDRPIDNAKVNHPTNWHLSTNRANSVVTQLARAGINEHRLGAAGYSMNQPVTPNTDDQSRQRNRRVEIFVLAPDAMVAGWDPRSVR